VFIAVSSRKVFRNPILCFFKRVWWSFGDIRWHLKTDFFAGLWHIYPDAAGKRL
jgi:hypothetical protein